MGDILLIGVGDNENILLIETKGELLYEGLLDIEGLLDTELDSVKVNKEVVEIVLINVNVLNGLLVDKIV